MARGEAGLPAQFHWRDILYEVRRVLEEWKTSSPEGGSGELYLRRHWFRIVAAPIAPPTSASTRRAAPIDHQPPPDPLTCTLYCLRRATPHQAKRRWWLYSWSPTRASR
jgi:hypothetical protein